MEGNACQKTEKSPADLASLQQTKLTLFNNEIMQEKWESFLFHTVGMICNRDNEGTASRNSAKPQNC